MEERATTRVFILGASALICRMSYEEIEREYGIKKEDILF
jgi:hypothetical protein